MQKKDDSVDVDLIRRYVAEQIADAIARGGNPFDESFWEALLLTEGVLPIDPSKVRIKPGKIRIPEIGWIKIGASKLGQNQPPPNGKLIRATLRSDRKRGFYIELEYEIPEEESEI